MARGGGSAGGFSVRSSLSIWIPWGRVAKSQAQRAQAARQALHNAQGNPDTTLQSEAIGEEMEAAVVAVCAAVFAVEAIVKSVAKLVIAEDVRRDWKRNPRRYSISTRMRETFTAALTDPALADILATRWNPLVQDRNAAVHFDEELRPLELHPSGLTHTAAESVTYSAERAQGAVSLLAETLIGLQDHHVDTVTSWASGQTALIEELHQH
jgi:hypothetical protein